ncbi:hypothetical protein Q9L58_008517 [Maublancomyces gigas]|uniref:Protein kinase domain-containing protein n=1 Tax=Discina gigas TaxID=1032678 RepID=A0ABR3G9H1_9PEZI
MTSSPADISVTATLHNYKLDTTFQTDTIVHTNSLLPGMLPPRMVTRTTSWKKYKKLGAGAFGVVWLEKEVTSGQLRAVKVISREQLNVREVHVLVDLQDHPRLFIQFQGWFEDQHAFYIAMEYMPHGDLALYISENGVKAATEFRPITSQILEGLVVLHDREICHRDLKPQNILIASPSPIRIKITDFGVSKQAVGTELRTHTGTLNYRAPEQLGILPPWMRPNETTYTKVIDIWALGIIVYEILCSELPFRDTSLSLDTLTLTSMPFTALGMGSTVDTVLLFHYCHGSTDLPSETLRARGVSENDIDFVKLLMTVNPKERVSAADALESLSLVGPDRARKYEQPRRLASPDPAPKYKLGRLAAPDHARQYEQLTTEFELLAVRLSPENAKRLYEEEDPTAIIDILGSPDMRIMQRTAVIAGSVEALKILLRVTGDIDSDAGLLQLASTHNQCPVIEMLLESGADVNTTSAGQTPLHAAAAAGHLHVMGLLMDKGASVDKYAPTENGQLPLHAAAVGGSREVMELLLERGADVDGYANTKNGQTALHGAAAVGDASGLEFLIDSDADISAYADTENGQTALYAAAAGGHYWAIWVLAQNADLDAYAASENGQTALHAAAVGGHCKVIDKLLKEGASVDGYANTKNGQTALYGAAAAGQFRATKLLLKNGASVDEYADTENGQAALYGAAAAGRLRTGASVNGYADTKNGQTALYGAAAAGQLRTVKLLLERGASVDAYADTENGQQPLHGAAAGGHCEAIRLLLDAGADVDAYEPSNEIEQTALYAAAKGGHLHAVKFLLDKGAVVNEWVLTAALDPVILEFLKIQV